MDNKFVENVPIIQDTSVTVTVEETQLVLGLFDTPGSSEYDDKRPLGYAIKCFFLIIISYTCVHVHTVTLFFFFSFRCCILCVGCCFAICVCM